MSPISRGFHGRRRDPDGAQGRVPPGQYVTDDFPVLSAGPTPRTPLEQWTFSVEQPGAAPRSWTWQEMRALPAETRYRRHPLRYPLVQARHAVGGGVAWTRCWRRSSTTRRYVLAFCDGGYTTNLPLADVTGGQAWLAFGYDGEPLDPEHGGPARLLVPAPVLLEERQVGARAELLDTGRAGLLGDLRLPHVRRSMAGTAVRGRLTWQVATVGEVDRRDRLGPDDRARRA